MRAGIAGPPTEHRMDRFAILGIVRLQKRHEAARREILRDMEGADTGDADAL